MMTGMRRLARNALARAGLQRIRHPGFIDLIRHHRIATVFDVGANDGHFGSELRDAGYRGRIVSFEPVPAVFERLRRRSGHDPDWHVYNLALGERAGPQQISVSSSDVFSSLKPPSAYAAAIWTGLKEERRETIEVVRLDAFLADHPEYASDGYLKIDTQGFEMEVIRGAGDRLSDFRYVQAELALRPLYDGQEGWTAVIDWMARHGFIVSLAKENGVDWQALRLVEMDFVFERADR